MYISGSIAKRETIYKRKKGIYRIKKEEKGILEGSMDVFYRSDLRATLTDRQRGLEILAIFG